MKKLIAVLAIGIACVSNQMAQAQTNYMDSESLAQAFLLRDTDHYLVYLSSWNYANGQYTSFDMRAMLDQSLFVTNLTIMGTNIPLPKPLSGMPIPKSGYGNVNMDVYALDKYGNTGSHGAFQTNYLGQGVPVTVSMIPQFPPVALQLQPGLDPNTIQVQVSGANGWGWSYDPSTGLLTISVWDAGSGSATYVITDSSGGLLAHGSLPFFQPVPGAGSDTNSVLNLHNAGGVLKMPLGANGYNYANGVHFDGSVRRKNVDVPAKVIGVPDIGNRKLYVNVYNPDGVYIEIRRWSATGTMEVVPATVTYDKYGNATAVTDGYIDKAVVTITPFGKVMSTAFYVGVFRSY